MGHVSRSDFLRFVEPFRERLSRDKTIAGKMFDAVPPDGDESVWFALLVDEAAMSIALIEERLRPQQTLLELGGGIALCYAYLRERGFDIVSLEPCAEGFGDRYVAGQRVLEIMEVDAAGWLPLEVAEAPKLGRSFDLIFSHFVLEHISALEQAFACMVECLNVDGEMVHCCPNYGVPYEPHYAIPLVPLAPRRTELLFPKLRSEPLWQGLRFVTAREVRALCGELDLRVRFERGTTSRFVERMFTDAEFQKRQAGMFRAFQQLKRFGLLRLLEHLPARLGTPMVFTATRQHDQLRSV